MDFDDTPEEAAFRAEARAFLDANARRKAAGERVGGYGDSGAEAIAAAKAWQALPADIRVGKDVAFNTPAQHG